jgi:hypothetical protein
VTLVKASTITIMLMYCGNVNAGDRLYGIVKDMGKSTIVGDTIGGVKSTIDEERLRQDHDRLERYLRNGGSLEGLSTRKEVRDGDPGLIQVGPPN